MPKTDPKNLSKQENKTFDTVYYDNKLEDNIIDLFQILITVWKWKWLIIIVTVIAVVGSYTYSLRLPNIYKARTLLLPPKAKNYQSLNDIGIREIAIQKNENSITQNYNSGSIFNIFKQNLNSRSLHKKFIEEYKLIELLAPDRTPETRDVDIYSVFSGLINIEEKKGVTSLSIEMHNPQIAAQWVNDFTKFVDKETIKILVDNLQNLIENRIKQIEYSIESKRFIAEKRREDQIIRYAENAEIAKKLGIVRRVDATNIIQTTGMNVDIAKASSPLYYLGYEALVTEINVLRNRKSDDAFIIGLRDMQEELTLLRSTKLDNNNMSSVTVDQAAFPPNSPIKPDRKFIIYLTSVIAFFSAIILSLLIEFISTKGKKIYNNSQP